MQLNKAWAVGFCMFHVLGYVFLFRMIHYASKHQNSPPLMKMMQLPRSDRGIVICLHAPIFALGVSLIEELRCLNVRSRIEVHYCTPSELSDPLRQVLENDFSFVQVVDVCARAGLTPEEIPAFQNYWIKPLALLNSICSRPPRRVDINICSPGGSPGWLGPVRSMTKLSSLSLIYLRCS